MSWIGSYRLEHVILIDYRYELSALKYQASLYDSNIYFDLGGRESIIDRTHSVRRGFLHLWFSHEEQQ
jgi:hypothetical protein